MKPRFSRHWAGFKGETAGPVLNLMYLRPKYFRMPRETMRVLAAPLSDDELRALRMPVLLLMGDSEAVCYRAEALARAGRLIPQLEGAIVPGCIHDMCFSQRVPLGVVFDRPQPHGADPSPASHLEGSPVAPVTSNRRSLPPKRPHESQKLPPRADMI